MSEKPRRHIRLWAVLVLTFTTLLFLITVSIILTYRLALKARYEAELTLLVFSAWKGLNLKPVPVRVSYPEDRVSHFRPFRDFARISLLNTVLLFIALVYGYPRTLLRKI